MSNNAVTVDNLVKIYGSVRAVDDISFKVEKGSIFAMLGPNGAGKTTTIECLIGLRRFDSGTVSILDMDPAINRDVIYKRIGVQLQETSYQDKIRVSEICILFSSFYSNPLPWKPLLERMELGEKSNSYVSRLSGGQRQKLSIVLALISDPEIVFLDELTTGLDPHARRNMWESIRYLKNEGKTIFMTTHYMEEAEYLCDTVCIINSGKIAAIGSVGDVIDGCGLDLKVSFNSSTDMLGFLEGMKPLVSRIVKEANRYTVFSSSEQMPGKLIAALENNKIPYEHLNIWRPNLEDAFLNLTGVSLDIDGQTNIRGRKKGMTA